MRVLVTGGGGFVGQHLLRELLAAGHAVTGGSPDPAPPRQGALSAEERLRVQWLPLDVTSDASVARVVDAVQPEWVFHLAAQSSVSASFTDPLATWEVNATGTLRLLEALERLDLSEVRVLVVSSAEVYGRVPEAEQPIAEMRPLAPVTPYGASKAAAEMAALQANARGRVSVVITRSFNHFGPGQEEHFALPSFASQLVRIRRGGGESVLKVGNLEVRRDLLDVRDVVRAYLRLMTDASSGQVYNVCSGEAHLLSKLVEELVALSGTGARIEVDPERFRPVDIPLLAGDPSRIHSLGWRPEIPLRQTLSDLLEAVESR
ncbi:GDP-mannose 4,6-dehydratase [soil metagenome]